MNEFRDYNPRGMVETEIMLIMQRHCYPPAPIDSPDACTFDHELLGDVLCEAWMNDAVTQAVDNLPSVDDPDFDGKVEKLCWPIAMKTWERFQALLSNGYDLQRMPERFGKSDFGF